MTFFDRYKMKIVGCTLEYNISGPYSRPLEIRSWLQKRPEVKNFVILDDDKWKWNWMEPFVVCTEDIKGKGLHGKFVQKAIDIINGKNIWLKLTSMLQRKRGRKMKVLLGTTNSSKVKRFRIC